LGIESSCDECSASLVTDGRKILSLRTATQTAIHARFDGVVPELASRAHIELVYPVVAEAIRSAGNPGDGIDLVAVTNRPGLSGSLTVGLSFAKAFAAVQNIPFVAVDHILAHAYAVQLRTDNPQDDPPEYPYLVLLVSGGHTLIGISRSPDLLEVLGTTIDDACGEAFDKVSTYLGLGYPGGPAIDRLAQSGNKDAYHFPKSKLNNGNSPFDMSYSGLKTAVIHQRERFRDTRFADSAENIAASFQKAAIEVLVSRIMLAVEQTGITRVAAGGGVAANSYLRARLLSIAGVDVFIPSIELCMDNGAMVAGLGFHQYSGHGVSSMTTGVRARVPDFRYTDPVNS